MYPASISPQAQLGQGYLKATEWESEREKIHKYIHNYINYIYIHTYRHPFIHTSDVYSGRFPVTSFAAPVPRNELWKLHSVLPRQWIGDVLLFRVDGERSKEAHSATPGIGLQCLQALQISLTLPLVSEDEKMPCFPRPLGEPQDLSQVPQQDCPCEHFACLLRDGAAKRVK